MKRELLRGLAVLVCLQLGACAGLPGFRKAPPASGDPVQAVLAYRPASPPPGQRPPAADAGGDEAQAVLRLQWAIHLANLRPPELPRAIGLLDAVLASRDANARALLPLARTLHEQYTERLRLEQQLREAQARAGQLQEKIEALSAIEKSLPVRPSRSIRRTFPAPAAPALPHPGGEAQ